MPTYLLPQILSFWNKNKELIFSDQPSSIKKVYLKKLIDDLKRTSIPKNQEDKIPFIQEVLRKLDIISQQLDKEYEREKRYLPIQNTPIDKETLINKIEEILG